MIETVEKNPKPPLIVEPAVTMKPYGSATIVLPAETVKDFSVNGFIERGKIYIKHSTGDIFRCPKGHVRPYFLKRNETRVNFCADCGEAFV